MAKSRITSRGAFCDEIAQELLNGRSITQNELSVLCTRAGGHETSRVLDVLRNRRGLPIQTTSFGSYGVCSYYIQRDDRNMYRKNPERVAEMWRSEAIERAIDRKLQRVWLTLDILAKRRGGALRSILDYLEVRL